MRSCDDIYDLFAIGCSVFGIFLSKMLYVLLEHFELISSVVFVISINVRIVRFLALYYLAPSLFPFLDLKETRSTMLVLKCRSCIIHLTRLDSDEPMNHIKLNT